MRFLFFTLLLLILSSCSPDKNENNIQSRQNTQIVEQNSSLNRYTENEKAKRIAKSILSKQGVKKVVVVISGEKALIGLDINEKKQKNKNYYEEIAIRKTQEVDSNISDIQVTTDKNMYNRISKLNKDIENKKPLSGVLEEFMNFFNSKLTKE